MLTSRGAIVTITTNGKTISTGSNVGTGSSSTSDSSTSTPNWWTKMSTAEVRSTFFSAPEHPG